MRLVARDALLCKKCGCSPAYIVVEDMQCLPVGPVTRSI